MSALHVDDLVAGYGSTLVLEGVSFELPSGSALAVLGRNGAGKTTLLRTLMGYTTRHRGSIRLGATALEDAAVHERARAGFSYVPQGRDIFPSLSVQEHLDIATRPGGCSSDALYALFPSLAARRRSLGGQLSGGERQMLAIARALAGAPRVLLLDEPLEGLAPIVVDALFARLRELATQFSVVLVEQKVDLALGFAAQVIVLARGKIVYRGQSADLARDEAAQGRWLGVEASDTNR